MLYHLFIILNSTKHKHMLPVSWDERIQSKNPIPQLQITWLLWLHNNAPNIVFKPGTCQPQYTWFLTVRTSACVCVCVSVFVCVCVCPPLRLLITSVA